MMWVALAWLYVAGMMALVEASSPRGSLFGALITFVLYGVLPLAIVLYLMSAPARRRLRAQREQAQAVADSGHARDGRQHETGDPVAPE